MENTPQVINVKKDARELIEICRHFALSLTLAYSTEQVTDFGIL